MAATLAHAAQRAHLDQEQFRCCGRELYSTLNTLRQCRFAAQTLRCSNTGLLAELQESSLRWDGSFIF
ncbi:hypothetical protein KUCAC02_033830 [Chaenocephalus aceratus]|nr:hypothetical protein KUCAC02_033830 [Chaenocephalus aceratus]